MSFQGCAEGIKYQIFSHKYSHTPFDKSNFVVVRVKAFLPAFDSNAGESPS